MDLDINVMPSHSYKIIIDLLGQKQFSEKQLTDISEIVRQQKNQKNLRLTDTPLPNRNDMQYSLNKNILNQFVEDLIQEKAVLQKTIQKESMYILQKQGKENSIQKINKDLYETFNPVQQNSVITPTLQLKTDQSEIIEQSLNQQNANEKFVTPPYVKQLTIQQQVKGKKYLLGKLKIPLPKRMSIESRSLNDISDNQTSKFSQNNYENPNNQSIFDQQKNSKANVRQSSFFKVIQKDSVKNKKPQNETFFPIPVVNQELQGLQDSFDHKMSIQASSTSRSTQQSSYVINKYCIPRPLQVCKRGFRLKIQRKMFKV
eukprot:403334909